MALATRHAASVVDALYWYRTARLPALDHRTPEDATAEGLQARVCSTLALRAANDEPQVACRISD